MMHLGQHHVGRLFRIRFRDHSENVGHVVMCEAYGRLVRLTRLQLILRAWEVLGDCDDNTDYAILRSAIVRADELQPV